MQQTRPLAAISDDELLRRLAELLAQNRRVESDLVAHIAEVDERRLYARYAAPSMFAYCTEVLHLSEAEAYLRTTAARASRQHPVLLEMLAEGRLHLSGIVLLAPFLTVENRDALLARATNRSKQQIKELIAEIAPQPDTPAVMRRLPERRALPTPASPLHMGGVPSSAASAVSEASGLGPSDVMATPSGMGKNVTPGSARSPGQPAWPSPRGAERLRQVIQPLSPSRYKVQFTASAELHDKLERLRALMRPEVPDGDLGAIIERAVSEKIERLEARRFASTSRPRKGLLQAGPSPSSRHIPAAVRRAVHERDGDRCCYVDETGRRCSERGQLEYHHRHPFGLGGDHSLKNLRLMCHAHNSYLAEHDYGREAMARHRRPGNGGPGAIAITSLGYPLMPSRTG